MIYEVRTYTLRPGSVAEFEERYQKRLPLREKHSKLGAFWHTEFGPLNQVVHVYPYDDLRQRTAVRTAMAQDAARNAMPGGGELIVAQEAEIMNPAPFMRPLGSRDYGSGNVYEMRTYTYAPGDIPKVLDGWAKAIEAREKFSPLAACWTSELGGLNKFVHVWVYKDLNERARVREESRRPGTGWPAQTGVRPVRQENKLLIPAAFSPVRYRSCGRRAQPFFRRAPRPRASTGKPVARFLPSAGLAIGRAYRFWPRCPPSSAPPQPPAPVIMTVVFAALRAPPAPMARAIADML